jgi:hypothetical protein
MFCCRLYFGRQPSPVESMENGNVRRLVRCAGRESCWSFCWTRYEQECAVFNLVPRSWKLGVEVMDLRRVNLFTPFLSPVLPYLGSETSLLEDTLVSTSEQLTWLNFV